MAEPDTFLSAIGLIALVLLGGASFWFFLHTLAKVYDTANGHAVLEAQVTRKDKADFEDSHAQCLVNTQLEYRIAQLEKRRDNKRNICKTRR